MSTKNNLGWWIHGPCLKGDLYSHLEHIHDQLWLHPTFIGFSLTSNLLSCWSKCFMYPIAKANYFIKSAALKQPCCHVLTNFVISLFNVLLQYWNLFFCNWFQLLKNSNKLFYLLHICKQNYHFSTGISISKNNCSLL